MSILVVGSVALDSIETPFGKVDDALGGSATYISTAAKYFTQPVRIVAVVGTDFPKEHVQFLDEASIDIEGLQVVEGNTFRWGGKYHDDLNTRDTLYTKLGVFEHFNPVIPESYRRSQYVCLGNIDPPLQMRVLEQIEKPRLVVCDTMNLWINIRLHELLETLRRVDVVIVNDSEARMLTGESNLIVAAKKLLTLGPRIAIIKKGEHGAILLTENTFFSLPAYPLEKIFDPTGAGDCFAGGFIGWLARTDDVSDENLKRAVVFGSTLASFCVEKFSLDGIRDLSFHAINERFQEFRSLTHFDD